MIIFVDSDVIISSLLSSLGAAHLLLNSHGLQFYISNFSYKELILVCKRLKIDETKLEQLLKKLQIVKINSSINIIKKEYEKYVTDIDDAHIIAGSRAAHADFLITYNVKHFEVEQIKSELGIIVLTPARLMQYLRSLK